RLGQDVIEVVPVDVHGLPLLERTQRRRRLAGQVGQDADDERQLDLLHRPVGLDVVADLYARPAYAIQLVLHARHGTLSSDPRYGTRSSPTQGGRSPDATPPSNSHLRPTHRYVGYRELARLRTSTGEIPPARESRRPSCPTRTRRRAHETDARAPLACRSDPRPPSRINR